MLHLQNKYPAFDSLELHIEREYTNQAYTKLNPAKAGDYITGLTLRTNSGKWHPHFDENLYSHSGKSFAYTRKPLVLYFYSGQWGSVGLEHLAQLNILQHELQHHYSNLLVISSQSDADVKQVLWDNNLQLPFYSDPQNEIAGLFGIYNENSPAWNRYAGIDENIPLPAVFVLDHSRQVIYDHLNENITGGLPSANIISAVYQANKHLTARRSA